MKTTYTLGKLSFEIQADTAKGIVEELGTISEIFGNTTCGICRTKDASFRVRTVDDNKYYELVCSKPSCRARFSFGQHKKNGTLFPKTSTGKGKDRKWLPNGGWSTEFSNVPTQNDEE